ncbi:MAG: hypothetical protein R3F34_16375 [Planctomycetota bacterium]
MNFTTRLLGTSTFEGPRVLGATGRALADLEDAELAELEPVALGELVDDLVQEPLDQRSSPRPWSDWSRPRCG